MLSKIRCFEVALSVYISLHLRPLVSLMLQGYSQNDWLNSLPQFLNLAHLSSFLARAFLSILGHVALYSLMLPLARFHVRKIQWFLKSFGIQYQHSLSFSIPRLHQVQKNPCLPLSHLFPIQSVITEPCILHRRVHLSSYKNPGHAGASFQHKQINIREIIALIKLIKAMHQLWIPGPLLVIRDITTFYVVHKQTRRNKVLLPVQTSHDSLEVGISLQSLSTSNLYSVRPEHSSKLTEQIQDRPSLGDFTPRDLPTDFTPIGNAPSRSVCLISQQTVKIGLENRCLFFPMHLYVPLCLPPFV
ncbi:uncharacterized protein LOC122794213 [Protopterus annectens]|uniref:uncharacterized protein LOC122794213 n=1 Tax=Protopterus annectens TaxID=7888 RepID=UPI001CFA27C8|nr:uncharacterized protein LOC122794213 [Protopterus annectens]